MRLFLNTKRTIIVALVFPLFFSLKLSPVTSKTGCPDEDVAFIPDCGGLLPDNYEYIEFLKKVAAGFVSDNTKQSDRIAKKIFLLVALRHSSVLNPDDFITHRVAKDFDGIIADKLCDFAAGKKQNDLWHGSPIVKKWVKENINDLTAQVGQVLQLALKLRSELAMSEKEKSIQKKKVVRLETQSQSRAEKVIKKLKKSR